MPAQVSPTASTTASSAPLPSRTVRRCAAAAGPTISVNTSSTPSLYANVALSRAVGTDIVSSQFNSFAAELSSISQHFI